MKIIIIMLSLIFCVLGDNSVEIKAVILTSGCNTNFWGVSCFTSVKTLEENPRVVRLMENYGERGDTIIVFNPDTTTSFWYWSVK